MSQGKVERAKKREYGEAILTIKSHSDIFKGLKNKHLCG